MSLRILHVLDHSIPLHSGYTFRTLSILREQRKLGWQTFQLTSPKQLGAHALEEDVEGWHFYRTLPGPTSNVPGLGEIALMRQLERRLRIACPSRRRASTRAGRRSTWAAVATMSPFSAQQ